MPARRLSQTVLLAVAPSHRRQGIGKRLVAEGLAALAREGIQKCHLLVFAGNAEGRRFGQCVASEHRDKLAPFEVNRV